MTLVRPVTLRGQLQSGLDGVGAGRAGKLNAIVQAARFKDQALEVFQKLPFGRGEKVQPMGYAVPHDVVEQGLLHVGVIMTIVE